MEPFKDRNPENQDAKSRNSESDLTKNGLPSVNLPKGGGAIRGIGEKFTVNAATGTGTASIPIYTSPGRAGFHPNLSLGYNSGSGNGPFGIGWQLSVPAITRKTDKGLPRYNDAVDSDVFLISEAEDLMPVLTLVQGIWQKAAPGNFASPAGDTYDITRYRPRIEGLFARIERWQRRSDGDVHWRATTRENVVSIYGQSVTARIADPGDATRVFKWMLEATFDDKGNVIWYEYKPEDKTGLDLTMANERNRTSTNTYLKRICYGNQSPYVLWEDLTARKDWLFECIMDYGEYTLLNPTPTLPWIARPDPFSTFRSTFEVRTYRLCQRVLMFHHFPAPVKGQSGYDGLVRATVFQYDLNGIATRLISATQTGYLLDPAAGTYTTDSFPPITFTYSQAVIDPTVYTVDPGGLENVPAGLAGKGYQWIDLDGEGSGGILFQQGDALYYTRNSSPSNTTFVQGIERAQPRFRPQELVRSRPAGSTDRFMDISGDGHQDLVSLDGPMKGFYRRTENYEWEGFRPFERFPSINPQDPNVKFLDVDGDGLTDILVSEDDVLSWHRSLNKVGYGERQYMRKPYNEEQGPALIFADPTECMFLADMTGDGLSDIVRIRNGEVCYWPNRGYGLFGAKVSMDNAPCFDDQNGFDQRRIRLADIDGSGTTDIVYISHAGIKLFFNQAGNAWSNVQLLENVPAVNNLADIQVMDLLGNGLSCLVWSSPLPIDAGSPMHYIDLMGGQKPYLMTGIKNNMGAETRMRYVSSSKFYVEDREAGIPWVTRLAFPVYVVERMEVLDYIGRTKFVSTYRYRHGYFDGVEREFRGFGYVEQRDAETFSDSASLFTGKTDPEADRFRMPPIITKTWYHTGAWPRAENILSHMAHEYYSLPGTAGANLLPDIFLPTDVFQPDGSRVAIDLSGEEEREAVRALKGNILRQEIYAADGSALAGIPYSVSEHNYTVECFQPQGKNWYAVFFTHPRESMDMHLERNPKDPRVTHEVVIDVDPFGNVLRHVGAAYGRNIVQAGLTLAPNNADLTKDPSIYAQPEQLQPLFTINETTYIPAIDSNIAYRGPMISEALSYELTRPPRPDESVVYAFADLQALIAAATVISFETLPDLTKVQMRLVEDTRTYYLKNDLTPLPFNQNDSLGLVFQTYKLAFTAGLVTQVLITNNSNPNKPANTAALGAILSGEGGYNNLLNDGNWWVPSGQLLYSPVGLPPNPAFAVQHFYLPQAYQNPFGQYTQVTYDGFDLLVQQTADALGNTSIAQNDYRVLQPSAVTDPNQNITLVAYDILSMACGTAVQGKNGTESGDSFTTFTANLTQATIDAFYNAPDPSLLGTASTRIVYDLQSFANSVIAQPNDPTKWIPVFTASLARETHVNDTPAGVPVKVRISFSYSDGFGREIQHKIQAEPGPLDLNNPASPTIDPRWSGSGWIILNNKGKPVRQYEPFFSATHQFEFANKTGVAKTLLYDPLERVVATLHPDHSWEKTIVTPWMQETWDNNDTVLMNPQTDPDVGAWINRLPVADYLPTWYGLRTDPVASAAAWPDPEALQAQQDAVAKASAHNDTPAQTYFDSMGRTFLTVAHNRSGPNTDQYFPTRVQLDIQENQLSITDALGRLVIKYDYDVLTNKCHQAGMESGERWILGDVQQKTIRYWDSRGFLQTRTYDVLRRPESLIVTGNGLNGILTEKSIYGDSNPGAPPNPEQNNLRTRLYQSYDSAGLLTHVGYDFNGNLLRSTRQIGTGNAYKATLDWNQLIPLGETFTRVSRFDALNRVIQEIAPYSTGKLNILQPTYNQANFLETLDAWLEQAGPEPQTLLDPLTATLHAVTNIDYDAKGQRTSIVYGINPQVNTAYAYDPDTFRLVNLTTTRSGDGVLLQDLLYYYDPIGNITHTQDNADIQNVVFFKNKRVEPSAAFVYDALYRLTQATGREHLGQNTPSYNDWTNLNLPQPGDGNAMGTYTENYTYDAIGNLQNCQHLGTFGWSRGYTYAEASQLEAAKLSNRLSKTTVGGTTETYGYDSHGNMLDMPQLQIMQWDYKDQLQMTQRQRVDGNDTDGTQHQGERTYYVYDVTGRRIRKVTDSANGQRTKERIYLEGFEVYREYDNAGNISLERDSLHIMDDKQRIALVETRTAGNDNLAAQLIRYQFTNDIGSACLELDDQANVLTYEEYYPYGSTAYQAVTQMIRIAAKRYRYTGMERDEESGLEYHTSRYYAPWIGRWTNCDRDHSGDNILRLYVYVRSNPIKFFDAAGNQEKKPSTASKIWKWANQPISEELERSKQSNQEMTDALNEDAKNSHSIWKWIKAALVSQDNDEIQSWPNTPLSLTFSVGTAAAEGYVANRSGGKSSGGSLPPEEHAEGEAPHAPTGAATSHPVSEPAAEHGPQAPAHTPQAPAAPAAAAAPAPAPPAAAPPAAPAVPAPAANTPGATPNVHKNSLNNKDVHHLYVIHDRNNPDTPHKVGISGVPLNKNGTSKRANVQVNALNRAHPVAPGQEPRFHATIESKTLPGREAASATEQHYVNVNKATSPNGTVGKGQDLPKPNDRLGPLAR